MSVNSLTYDNMYRVTGKSQHLSQTGVQFDGTLSAGYDLKYTYSGEEGKRFQLAGVDDINYSAEAVTEDTKVMNAHAYEYDANGNLVFVNTSRTKKDGQTTPNAGERKLKWDEENRLTASDDNGFVTSYWYDASGERTVKSSGENAAMFVNAEFAGGTTNTAKFSLYVSPYLVANQGGRYTKHIYIGSQRIVSKLGDLKSYGADPRRIEYAGSESDGPKVDYKTKYALQQQVIKDNFAHFDVPYNGADNNDYVDGKGFSESDGSLKSAMLKAAMAKEGNKSAGLKDNFQQGDSYEQYQYFYHPDHLGSSSFITNSEGEVVQHIEYVPYGEVFIEERNNVWNTPYLFNAKEFDEETGLYYYGARYYDSRLAMWYGVDALTEKYPNMGGYVYCANNPVKLVDPDGRKIKGFSVNENGEVICNENLASSDAQDIYNKAVKTEVGKNAFVDMINSDTDIELVYSNEATEDNGLTDGCGYNSNTGLYTSATVTIYRENIESDASDDKGRFASLEEGIIATVVHESIHLSKDQIKLDRKYGRMASKKRHRALYYLLEQNTMNKEYKAVKEYRKVTKSSSTKGYDRYEAETDYNGITKPNFTNSKDYPSIINDLNNYKRKK